MKLFRLSALKIPGLVLLGLVVATLFFLWLALPRILQSQAEKFVAEKTGVADAAGAHAVVAPKDRACGLNATAIKVASAAADTVPYLTVTNLARSLRELQERNAWVVGAAGEAERDLYDIEQKGALAWVLGAEGTGLRRLTRETCDELARIPMQGQVESLNVSVAAGVCLFEAVRQRR